MRTICIIIITTFIIPSNAEDACIQSQSHNEEPCCELTNKCIFPFKHFGKKYESCTNQNTKYESICKVKENHCFPSLAEDSNDYGGGEPKKCKDASEIDELKNTHINGHYCKIQPDQRSDEETWSKCSANCLDNGNPIEDETGVCTTEPQKCKFPFKVGYDDMNYFQCVSDIDGPGSQKSGFGSGFEEWAKCKFNNAFIHFHQIFEDSKWSMPKVHCGTLENFAKNEEKPYSTCMQLISPIDFWSQNPN